MHSLNVVSHEFAYALLILTLSFRKLSFSLQTECYFVSWSLDLVHTCWDEKRANWRNVDICIMRSILWIVAAQCDGTRQAGRGQEARGVHCRLCGFAKLTFAFLEFDPSQQRCRAGHFGRKFWHPYSAQSFFVFSIANVGSRKSYVTGSYPRGSTVMCYTIGLCC